MACMAKNGCQGGLELLSANFAQRIRSFSPLMPSAVAVDFPAACPALSCTSWRSSLRQENMPTKSYQQTEVYCHDQYCGMTIMVTVCSIHAICAVNTHIEFVL